jgi:hypothetical protein
MMPSINWESPWLWFAIIAVCVSLAVHAATLTAIGILLFKKAKSNVHKGAQALSSWMKGLGFSETVTAPLDDVASGNVAAFASDGLSEVRYLHDAANRQKELKAVFSTALADPVVGPPLTQYLKDKLGGASDAVLTADGQKLQTAFESTLPQLPNQAHFDQFMHVLDSLHAGNTSMADITGLVSTNPAFAGISGFASKLLAFGHDMGTAAAAKLTTAPDAAAAARLVAGAGSLAGPTLLLANPLTAPVAVPAAAAAVAAGVTVSGLLDGHNVAISAVPGTPAAAAA